MNEAGAVSPAKLPLAIRAGLSLALLTAAQALALVAAAGTFAWPAAWIFLGVFVACVIAVTTELIGRDPTLVARRIRGGPTVEVERSQKLISALAAISYFGIFIVGGLDHRFGWLPLPTWIEPIGDVMVAVGFVGVWRVFKENSYAASTIGVEQGQRVISSGPYALVRHPMYTSSILMLAGMPLAPGSAVAVLPYGL
ncbi:MAG TPA: isoprenylcysteine carboxylmethyltransferase family protein [Caulobacteraceae bacterium]|nr:isoprenylcysteine carboxylmethyltransferase family protein [Caulobacteraceae bacterium]